jgi:hypothetical protein
MSTRCYIATPPFFTVNMDMESTHLVGGGNDASRAGWCVSIHANAVAKSQLDVSKWTALGGHINIDWLCGGGQVDRDGLQEGWFCSLFKHKK